MLLALAFMAMLPGCTLLGEREFEVSFTTKDIQTAIDKAPLPKPYTHGLIEVSLARSPIVEIGKPQDRIGVTSDLAVQVAGLKPLPVKAVGSFKLVYVEARKAFYLDKPMIHSLDAPLLPKAMANLAMSAIEHQLTKSLNVNPIYTLRDDGPIKEQLAKRTLKSIQVRDDQVVAKFVPR